MTAPPRMRVVIVLLAGRSAFRGTVVLSAPVLLALWGKEAFASYAVAVGTTLVLNPLVGSGAEKSAGKLLARETGGAEDASRNRLMGAHLAVVPLIAALSGVVALVVVPYLPGPTELYLLAAATNIGFGAVQALVGYWRVLGRPYVDAASHTALAVVTVLGVVLAALADAGPQVVLGLQALVALAITGGLAAALLHRAVKPCRSELARTARTTVLMGANTLLCTAALSVLFAMLVWHDLTAAASHLYLAVAVYTVVANLLDYLLRVFQPWLAAALADGATSLLRTAERSSRLGLLVLVPLSAATVLLLNGQLSGTAQAMLAVGAVAPALLAVAALIWVLENLDLATLIGTVLAGALGLFTTCAVAYALLSTSAVIGSALALLVGGTVTTVALLPMLHRRLTDSHRDHPSYQVWDGIHDPHLALGVGTDGLADRSQPRRPLPPRA